MCEPTSNCPLALIDSFLRRLEQHFVVKPLVWTPKEQNWKLLALCAAAWFVTSTCATFSASDKFFLSPARWFRCWFVAIVQRDAFCPYVWQCVRYQKETLYGPRLRPSNKLFRYSQVHDLINDSGVNFRSGLAEKLFLLSCSPCSLEISLRLRNAANSGRQKRNLWWYISCRRT